jgi:hypothetical protein
VVTSNFDFATALSVHRQAPRRTTTEQLGGSLWDSAYFFSYAVLLRH